MLLKGWAVIFIVIIIFSSPFFYEFELYSSGCLSIHMINGGLSTYTCKAIITDGFKPQNKTLTTMTRGSGFGKLLTGKPRG